MSRVGSLDWIGEMTEDEKRSFWSHVRFPRDRSVRPCWEWRGSRAYPQFRLRGRLVMAHRLSYFDMYRVDPGAMLVLHSCDNGRCINPRHLRLGGNPENAADREVARLMMGARRLGTTTRDPRWDLTPEEQARIDNWPTISPRRGRISGETHPNASITNAKANEMRAAFWAGTDAVTVAAGHSVPLSLVRNIVRRMSFRALPLVPGEPALRRDLQRAIDRRRFERPSLSLMEAA